MFEFHNIKSRRKEIQLISIQTITMSI